MAGYPRPGQFGIDPDKLPKDLRKEMTQGEVAAGTAFDADQTREKLTETYSRIAAEIVVRELEGQ